MVAPAQLVAGAVCTLPGSAQFCAFWTRIRASAVVDVLLCKICRSSIRRNSASKLESVEGAAFCRALWSSVAASFLLNR